MKSWQRLGAAAAFVTLGVPGAQAASVICGDATLGLRTATVDPAKTGGMCSAGLTNLGDGALVSLVNSLVNPAASTLIDRDTANNNGGPLGISGLGLTSGAWSFSSTAWNVYDRLFLYFHFGDARDNPSPASTTDPDIFIVELKSPDASGTWQFNGQQGLSNMALIGSGASRLVRNEVPEPTSALLAGLGMAALVGTRRRKSV